MATKDVKGRIYPVDLAAPCPILGNCVNPPPLRGQLSRPHARPPLHRGEGLEALKKKW